VPIFRQSMTRRLCAIVAAAVLTAARAAAQAPPAAQPDDIQALRQAIAALQAQLADTRRDADALRQKVDAMQAELAAVRAAPPANAAQQPPPVDDLLAAKVEEQEQTKVASGSKYRMRLSGFVLVNFLGTHGAVDSLDVPQTAVAGAAGSSFAASVRQSSVTLEVFAASLAGARTSGNVSFDFFGGFPVTRDGVTAPLVRMTTARVALDWTNASLTMGQESPFFSPRSPTSLAATAYPALSSAGNLWVWTPQLRAERRVALGDDTTLSLQGGVLDPLTGELPGEYERLPTAGERSALPAPAVRVGVRRALGAQALEAAAGAYYARQKWGARGVSAWAVTGDWSIPIGAALAVSGEAYHGVAIAGLGGGASAAVVVTSVSPELTTLTPVTSTGGWVQLKAIATPRLSFNGAYGLDNPSRAELTLLPALAQAAPSIVNRNASAFVNTIFQARSNFLMSIEYRRLWTTGLDEVTHRAHHFSFSTGIGF